MKPVKRSALTLFLAVLSFVAAAHPHSFIRLQTQVVSENEQFVALKMRWTMDALTSADLLYDAGNAAPGSEIWKKLAAEVMANVLGQHYFTEVWRNGAKVKFKNRPTEYGMTRDAHQAVLTFTLPLAEPQPLSGQTYTFQRLIPLIMSICIMTRTAISRCRNRCAKSVGFRFILLRPAKRRYVSPSRWIKRTRRRRIWI